MIAKIVFWGWPFVTYILFKRLPLIPAVLCSVLAGYLLLPRHITLDLPALPAITRSSMTIGTAIICALIVLWKSQSKGLRPAEQIPLPRMLPGWIPQNKVIKILFFGMVFGPAMTAITNRDVVVDGGKALEALGTYDIFSSVLTSIMIILPLVLARKFLAYEEGQRALLMALSIAGLIYSLPTLYEVRMSPQIYRIVYGVDGGLSWIQNLRGGGFRPAVFLGHGLTLGIFISCAVLATLGCMRAVKPEQKLFFLAGFIWLFVTLILVKALGSLLIAIAIIPIILLCSARMQLIAAACIALMVVGYPILRGVGLVPTGTIVNIAAKIDVQRSYSVAFRFDNEEMMLNKAERRPLFGWGGWGRSRVYENGKDITTSDGQWVIILGVNGWIGYLCLFGLLTASVIILAFKKKDYEVSIATSALCLVLVANLIDLIPNAGLSIVTWTIAGALAGRLEVGREEAEENPTVSKGSERTYPYARRSPRQRPSRHTAMERQI